MFCIPDTTDWSCAYKKEDLATMRANNADTMRVAEELAWLTLARLCAYRIGVCAEEIRPCSARCASTSRTWMQAVVDSASTGALPLRTIGVAFTPYVTGGAWVNGCGCASDSSCACVELESVYLPGPVGDIVSVKLDGVAILPINYRVDDGTRLVNLDPGTPWPTCQPEGADPDEGLVVTYYRGAAPNSITNLAAGVLASEFYKLCMGDSKCRLPAGTVSVVRGNTAIEIEPDLSLALRRIPQVAAVVDIYNPNGLKSPPRVISPDVRDARRPTWRTS